MAVAGGGGERLGEEGLRPGVPIRRGEEGPHAAPLPRWLRGALRPEPREAMHVVGAQGNEREGGIGGHDAVQEDAHALHGEAPAGEAREHLQQLPVVGLPVRCAAFPAEEAAGVDPLQGGKAVATAAAELVEVRLQEDQGLDAGVPAPRFFGGSEGITDPPAQVLLGQVSGRIDAAAHP